VNYAGTAPVRQPEPEMPEGGFPRTPEATEDHGVARRQVVVKLRLLWNERRLLSRAAVSEQLQEICSD